MVFHNNALPDVGRPLHKRSIVGDKVIKKQDKKHPSNEKVLAKKAGAEKAAKAAVTLAAAKPGKK